VGSMKLLRPHVDIVVLGLGQGRDIARECAQLCRLERHDRGRCAGRNHQTVNSPTSTAASLPHLRSGSQRLQKIVYLTLPSQALWSSF